mgnify:CR=1 FL=1
MFMTDAEDVMEKVQPNENKGQYGNTQGKSPNSLYKKYKTWAEDNGKSPMSFPQWMKWAQDKGLVKGNYSADAVTDDKQKEDVTPPAKSNKKIIVGLLLVSLAFGIYMGYRNKTETN